jgi:hypothetical protein
MQTTYWLIGNDYDDYKRIEQKTIYRSKTHFTKKYKLTALEWEQLVDMYEDDQILIKE